ncbi:MAG: hypothetical protein R3F34_10520 [Planctomycetota bacterium]
MATGWRTLLDLAAEVVTSATYPEERVRRQKARYLERLRVDEAEPRVQVGRLFRRLTYGDQGVGRPRRGTFETASRITRDDVARRYAETWVGSRAIIGVCGDLDPVEVRAPRPRARG